MPTSLFPSDVLWPVLNTPWFFLLDFIGTVAFALFGVILGYRERMSFFGTVILSLLPAVGGGLIRDLIVHRHPPTVLKNPLYLLTVFGVVGASFLLINGTAALRKKKSSEKSIFLSYFFLEICDAIGLAAFTVTGVVVAFTQLCQPLWLWGPLLGTLTACGGGILRDIFCSTRLYPLLRNSFYGEIAAIWGGILSVFFLWIEKAYKNPDATGGILCILLGIFLTRMLIVMRKIPPLGMRLF